MAFLSGADGGTRTRDLFLTKEVLYLLSYISVSMILTVCGDLRLPAFLPPDGFMGVRVPLGVPAESIFGGVVSGARKHLVSRCFFSPCLRT